MAELGTCYHARYLQASFNGVSFRVEEAGSEHGRRGAEGEFPFGNQTGYVDMGRKIRRYRLTARFDDNDHINQSSLLIAACELPGPGVLVHPTRGVLNASCTSLTVTDRPEEEQGVTRIELEFVEGELWQNGFGLVGQLLGIVLRPLLEVSSDQFRARYSIQADPIYRQPQARAGAQAVAAAYAQEYSRTQNPDPRAMADLMQVAEDPALVDDPALMDELVRKGSATISRGLADENKFIAFRRIANAATVATQTASMEALTTHVRVVAAGYMAQASTETEYALADNAIRDMDLTLAVLNQEADIAYSGCDNGLFLTLRDFTADYTRRMFVKAYGSPARLQYDFGGGVSPLQAAYAIWDDAARARELASGNQAGPYGNVGPVVNASPGA